MIDVSMGLAPNLQLHRKTKHDEHSFKDTKRKKQPPFPNTAKLSKIQKQLCLISI